MMEAHIYLAALGPGQGPPGLERINIMLNYLGRPEKRLSVVHVVGTNGKGSTAQFISSILQAAGKKVGLYTSPHLGKFNERIQINKAAIDDDCLADLLRKLYPCIEDLASCELGRPGMFEVATALALDYFALAGVDYAVLEAGLGGRYDATHVGQPVVTVFTHIDLDHTEILGETVELIAREKADVIPVGGTIVMAPQESGVKGVIRKVARARRARIIDVEETYEVTSVEKTDQTGTKFRVRAASGLPQIERLLQVGLLGLHQVTNAVTALATANVLMEMGCTMTEDQVLQGLATARWPGRLEIVGTEPLVVLDGAHNLDGFRQLALALPVYFTWDRLHLVMAIVGEKPVQTMLELLLPLADTVTFTTPQTSRTKPQDLEYLLEISGEVANTKEIGTAQTLGEAYTKVVQKASSRDLICICGSLYLVGEARHQLVDLPCSAGILHHSAEIDRA